MGLSPEDCRLCRAAQRRAGRPAERLRRLGEGNKPLPASVLNPKARDR